MVQAVATVLFCFLNGGEKFQETTYLIVGVASRRPTALVCMCCATTSPVPIENWAWFWGRAAVQ